MSIAREEIFGPVQAIMKFSSLDEVRGCGCNGGGCHGGVGVVGGYRRQLPPAPVPPPCPPAN